MQLSIGRRDIYRKQSDEAVGNCTSQITLNRIKAAILNLPTDEELTGIGRNVTEKRFFHPDIQYGRQCTLVDQVLSLHVAELIFLS